MSKLFTVLPLRDIVVFPYMIAPLFVGRDKSIRALEDAVRKDKKILLVTQKKAGTDDPKPEDLHRVGVIANILQLLKLPDGTVKVLVEGRQRVVINGFAETADYYTADVDYIDGDYTDEGYMEIEALTRSVINQFERYVKLNKKIAPEVLNAIAQLSDPEKISDNISTHIALKIEDKQKILEESNLYKRLELIYGYMENEIEVLNAEQKIRSRVKKQMEKTQKEYYLNEQLKAINKELGGGEDSKDEIAQLEERINKTKLSKEAKEKAKAELKKLKNMAPMSAEGTVIRNFLDWLLSVPWSKKSKIKSDLTAALGVLDDDHYGLEKVKERILEYLAVGQRTKKIRGPILCLVGPPGVGKTSLARSIAKSVGRNFVKISLGGVRDESEIRGHRRTYIGSMPGKIVQSMKKAKTVNPLFLLDEIDKMGTDFRGDPSAALLEVLDPEQNVHFNDHYLEVDYDLSDVMFVTTANTLNIPPALRDRMEIIRISGYTEDEKVEICKRHLIAKQKKMNGLKDSEWQISDEALRMLIRCYTREAGVRNLEREIANLTRKATKEILMNKKSEEIKVTVKNLEKYAGVRKFTFGQTEIDDMVGVVNGLAYTEVGGELLTIEAVSIPGKGNIKSTGKLGEVMQESAQAAFSFVRSKSTQLGVTVPEYQKQDIHIHVPEGATPKDGPSAGVAMSTAIVSVLTGIAVKKSVAMTGEVTLRGRVLPIGGLKEKLLGALRGGIKTVIIPKENQKDLADIPDNVKKNLEIFPVETVDEVLNIALVNPPKPVEWGDIDEIPASSDSADDDLEKVVTH